MTFVQMTGSAILAIALSAGAAYGWSHSELTPNSTGAVAGTATLSGSGGELSNISVATGATADSSESGTLMIFGAALTAVAVSLRRGGAQPKA